MFTLPYETTVASKLYKNLDELQSKIRKANLELAFPRMEFTRNRFFNEIRYTTPHNEHMDIPTFTQYLNIGTDKEPMFVLDGRSYLRMNKHTEEIKVVGESDWTFQAIRMALNLKEFKDGSSFYMGLGNVPAITFARWISGLLTARYNLSIESQMAINVICALYYLAMINPSLRVSTETRELELHKISQITGVDPDFAISVIEEIENLSNIEDLCHAISNHSRQSRTGQMKTQDLLMMLTSSWFGINARENIAIALEHLPTFNALVYMSLTSSLYRKSILAQRALSAGRDRDQKSYTDIIFRIVNDYLTQ